MLVANKISKKNSEPVEKIATFLWDIWFFMNKKIWEAKHITPVVILDFSLKQMVEWQDAMKRKMILNSALHRSAVDRNIEWKVPELDWPKFNVDSLLYIGGTSFTLGMVIRYELGRFVKGKNLRIHGSTTVMEAEVRRVKEAICWIEELALHHIIIESDSSLILNSV